MKKYAEIYRYYKTIILNGQMKSGDKLPSVRSACNIFSVSKTTVQNAYFELQADGYIISAPKSGYYVSDIRIEDKTLQADNNRKTVIKYDLLSGSADKDSFDILLWQRYIKSALRQSERLLTYSDVQGEEDLRYVLSDYIREKRNVTASPDRIVVGAGVQSLLSILCSLIKDRKTVSFPDESFHKGRSLFADYSFEVHTKDKDADVIYVSPSHMSSFGNVMPIKRRVELVRYSERNNSLVIEDDFDSDFLYNSKPTPSLFALAGGGNVVYMGSFSNVLVPGIRISFMVLTNELAKCFKQNKDKYAQTASKTEQIALCQYIRDGHMQSQTRKVRRLYTAKTQEFYEEILRQVNYLSCEIADNRLQIRLTVPYHKEVDEFKNNGIDLFIKEYHNGQITLILSPSAVSKNDIKEAVRLLNQVISE